jgi:iron complex outermembrane receptor protein
VFLYYGVADYPGADQADTPYVFGRSFLARDNIQVNAGEPVTFDIPDDHRSYRAKPRHKMHAQYTNGPMDVWVRYTRSGEQTTPERTFIALPPIGVAPPGSSFADLRTEEAGYQQITVFGSYTYEVSDDLSIEWWLSYDMFDFERILSVPPRIISHREDEYYTRLLARWTPVESHSVAFGVEYSHEIFGLDSPGFPHVPANTPRQDTATQPWETDAFSLLGEYQWRMSEEWTAFLSAREDKHTYSEWLLSPRAVLVYTPNECDTVKMIAAKAVRRIGDDELRQEFLDTGTFGDVETLKGYELRYERQQTDELWLALSGFYQEHAAVSFFRELGQVAGRSNLLGEFQMWGLEPEIVYGSGITRFTASHAYTKLLDATPIDPLIIEGISAAPYGFGNDLANWSNHLTKLYAVHELDECWSVSGSLRVYWGFPGARDLTEFNNSLPIPQTGIGLSDPDYEKAFRANVYLNGGLERKLGCCGAIRLDLYNVLGWFDKDLNKRNYINRVSEYRSEAAAVGLSMRMDF